MRVLAAEDGMQLRHLALPRERIQIMRHRHEVGLGRQLVERITPVGVGENAELPGFHQLLDAGLHIGEVARARSAHSVEIDCASAEVALGSAFSAETTSTQSSACR